MLASGGAAHQSADSHDGLAAFSDDLAPVILVTADPQSTMILILLRNDLHLFRMIDQRFHNEFDKSLQITGLNIGRDLNFGPGGLFAVTEQESKQLLEHSQKTLN